MLKRIDKNQLRVGMFIEACEGTWLDNPLVGRRFLLETGLDVKALQQSNLTAAFINTTMGLDVESPCPDANPAAGKRGPARAKTGRQTRHDLQNAEKVRAAEAIKQSSDLLKDIFDHAAAGSSVTMEMVLPVIHHITTSMEQNPSILIRMTRLKSKDATTFLHSIAVAALMIRFARHLKFDDETVNILGVSGLLHDIGKIGIPTDVLVKTGALTDPEMTLIRTHPQRGYDILLRDGNMPEIVLDVCLRHHERQDGKGYPNGISAHQISPYARIGTICDVYDAVTSARPYRKPWSHNEAAAWMLDTKGIFDQRLLRLFINDVLKD